MSRGAKTRRHERDTGQRSILVEREGEVADLEQSLAAAKDGAGRIVVIEAPAGKGKSRLLTVAGDMARDAGMQILGASSNELERDFPFGVAIQLFEPRWASESVDARGELLAGPAGLASGLLNRQPADAQHPPAGQAYSLIHGLFWLTCNLVSPTGTAGFTGGPMAMLVDDIHWADQCSLRFLSYLADRLSDLPVALVLAVRPAELSADQPALRALLRASTATPLRLNSLSDIGVESLVRAEFPDAEPDFVTACARVTNGNPFLLVELLAQVRADGRPSATAERLRGLVPEAIVNSVVARLGAMPSDARALASAVSVLGDRAALTHAARLAELEIEKAASAADELAAMHMFRSGEPLSFVHPMIRSAVTASISPLALGRAHRRAATVLGDAGAAAEIVAAHLLAAPPQSEAGAVEHLRAAAHKAMGHGAAESAVRFLERALAENPAPDVRPEVLGELAHAEALAGMPQAVEHLTDAIRLTERPDRRVQLALTQGRALYTQARYREAATVLDVASTELQSGDERLGREVNAAYVSVASLVPDLAEDAAPRRQRLLDQLTDRQPTSGERLALAHVAAHDSILGAPRATVRRLADLAWGDGALLDTEEADGRGWQLLTAALLFSDELEREVEICDGAMKIARERHSPILYSAANSCRTWPLYDQGRISDAIGDAEAAVDAQPHGWRTHFRPANGALACCLLQQGQLEAIGPALAAIEDSAVPQTLPQAFLLDVRAQLRLAQHRHREALADAILAGGHLGSDFAVLSPAVVGWRSTAALAQLGLGQPGPAEELAAEELKQAQRIGITRLVIRDLRILGLIAGGTPGLESLEEAVRIGEGYPPRLEYIEALLDLGGALRRGNHRVAARDPLRKALELSHRGGATVLTERARLELAAAGARPRRVMLSGIESLTPSERRVGELAVIGLTTRKIAESLFVSPKTVEFHLRHLYQKLDVSSRAGLADCLTPG